MCVGQRARNAVLETLLQAGFGRRQKLSLWSYSRTMEEL